MTVENPFSVPPAPLRASLRTLLGVGRNDGLEAGFAVEIAEANRRRLRVLLPIMVVGHLLHAAFFWVRADVRPTLSPTVALWRDGIAITHLVSAAIAVLLALIGRRAGKP